MIRKRNAFTTTATTKQLKSPHDDETNHLPFSTYFMTLNRMSLRFMLLLSGILLIDLTVLRCSKRWIRFPLTTVLFKGNHNDNHDETAAQAAAMAMTMTTTTLPFTSATSGRVYQIAKLRTFDESLLRFQPNYSNVTQRQQPSQQPTLSTSTTWPKGKFWNRPHCQNWGAATTIFPPTAAVEQFVALEGWCLVVAGDRKGPLSYRIEQHGEKLVFLSRERQEELAKRFEFVQKTPWNHFARKNVAYLYAIANGATFIWDFDDDNLLFPNETLASYTSALEYTTVAEVHTQNNTECGVFNPSTFFRSSELGVWPRGYPLDKINAPECQLSQQYCSYKVPSKQIGIYQSLADKDPDVDAVYRLTRNLPVTFAGAAKEDLPVLVPPHTMSPMNAQASLFSPMGMWSMFLPTTVHGRVSDIWRSYFAQAVGQYCGMLVTFVGPHVVQDRNAHTYLADMEAERQLYERSGSLVTYLLDQWKYNHGTEATMEGAMERLFVDMYERGIVELQDVELVQLWITSLQSVGYKFPVMEPPSQTSLVTIADQRNMQQHDKKVCKSWKTPFYFHDIVLVGQFNYDTPAKTVLDWVKKWRLVFQHVDARGPFNNGTLAFLNSLGVNAFWGADDRGFFSPMKNLADSLLLYSNTSSRGVIMAHDDLLFNVSRLMRLGFSRYDFILGEFHQKVTAKPYMTVFGNHTYKLRESNQLFRSNYTGSMDGWWWWDMFMPFISEAVANTLDGFTGVDFYDHGQSDFLYVPSRFAKEFSVRADWMVRNHVFLELGIPTIVGWLKENDRTLTYKTATLCTNWDRSARTNASMWLPTCLAKEQMKNAFELPYGTFHPVKRSVVGARQWNSMFDCIVLGDDASCDLYRE